MSWQAILESLEARYAADATRSLPKNYSKRDCYNDYKRVMASLRESMTENAEEVRELELLRLDQLMMVAFRQAMTGSLPAIDRVLKIMKQRDDLLGLAAPIKIAPTDPTGENPYLAMTPDERARAFRELIRGYSNTISGSLVDGEMHIIDVDEYEEVE